MTNSVSRFVFAALSLGVLLLGGILGATLMDPATAQQPINPLRNASFGACPAAIADHADPGMCIAASSVPEDGKLLPLGEELFVDPGGSVGIGTKSPTASLNVRGSFPLQLSGLLSINTTSFVVSGTSEAKFDSELRVGEAVKIGREIFQVNEPLNKFSFLIDRLPSETLDRVPGFRNTILFSAGSGFAGQNIAVDRFGNIGVGTDAPTAKLEVVGDVIVSGTISAGGGLPNVVISPIGSIVAWHGDLSGTPALPEGWEECNGQLINDPESPYYGVQLPDLNGQGRFLRGGPTSGVHQADEIRTHKHDIEYTGGNLWTTSRFRAAGGVEGATNEETDPPLSIGNPTGAAHGPETRPINMSVVWIMRVK